MKHRKSPQSVKYHIFIPQEKILKVAPRISLEACVILDYIAGWQLWSMEKAKKILVDNEDYIWINYDFLRQNLPLLRIKHDATIRKKIDELLKYKLIKTFPAKDNTLYARLSDLGVSLYVSCPPDSESEAGAASKSEAGMLQKVKQHNNTLLNTTLNNNKIVESSIQRIGNDAFEGEKEDSSSLKQINSEKIPLAFWRELETFYTELYEAEWGFKPAITYSAYRSLAKPIILRLLKSGLKPEEVMDKLKNYLTWYVREAENVDGSPKAERYPDLKVAFSNASINQYRASKV